MIAWPLTRVSLALNPGYGSRLRNRPGIESLRRSWHRRHIR
jgi:hypothetical protein